MSSEKSIIESASDSTVIFSLYKSYSSWSETLLTIYSESEPSKVVPIPTTDSPGANPTPPTFVTLSILSSLSQSATIAVVPVETPLTSSLN